MRSKCDLNEIDSDLALSPVFYCTEDEFCVMSPKNLEYYNERNDVIKKFNEHITHFEILFLPCSYRRQAYSNDKAKLGVSIAIASS
jgi:hypothetical protein